MPAEILTLTLHAMIEKRLWVNQFLPGEIHRCHREEFNAGGKGVNVARQLLRLNHSPLAIVCAGGHTSFFLRDLLVQDRIPFHILDSDTTLREGWTIYDDSNTEIASFFEPSAPLPSRMLNKITTLLASASPLPKWFACCGSAPDPASALFYKPLIATAKKRGISTALDSYGLALCDAVSAGPDLLKINASEAAALLKKPCNSLPDFFELQNLLSPFGISYLIVTNGPNPLFAADSNGVWSVAPPHITERNPTGSGDALLAGVLAGLTEEMDFPLALRWGVAAGATNASLHSVADSTRAEIEEMLPLISCAPVPRPSLPSTR